jgi:DNA repair protein RadD
MLEETREHFRSGVAAVLVQSPTGSGKTATAAYMLDGAARRAIRSWFVVHRRELVHQASDAFAKLDIPHGIIGAGWAPDPAAPVQIGMVQSLVRRMERLPPPGLIVFDEAHHIAAGAHDAIYRKFPKAKKTGLTATPTRLDGTGLGTWFHAMVHGPTVRELIHGGWLAPYRLYAPNRPDLSGVGTRAGDFAQGALSRAMDRPSITGDAVEHYRRMAAGQRAIVFCVGIAHSMSVAEQFNAAGFPAAHIDGETSAGDRDAAIADFAAGRVKILTNVDLVGEGFDLPAIEAAILLRPTKSLTIFLQQVGRCLRPVAGKTALILDHAGNTFRHGLPDDPRQWSLETTPKKKPGEAKEAAVKPCPSCQAVIRSTRRVCPYCGTDIAPPLNLPETVDGRLVEIDAETLRAMKYRDALKWADDEAKLRAIAAARGYQRGWIRHVLRERAGKAGEGGA